MGTSVKAVGESFELLFDSLRDPAFCKTHKLNTWGERDLLLLVRAFLLGFHGRLAPEHGVRLPGSASGMGRIDFLVDGVAVEFAVRRPNDGPGPLSRQVNAGEVKKLMMYDGKALLVLFDFSATPFAREQVEEFRDWPSLGRGRHRRSAFNVSYHYVDPEDGASRCHRMNIHVGS